MTGTPALRQLSSHKSSQTLFATHVRLVPTLSTAEIKYFGVKNLNASGRDRTRVLSTPLAYDGPPDHRGAAVNVQMYEEKDYGID